MWQKLLFIGLAGALGTLARYGLAGLVQRATGGGFPWGTATVNILGCLLFGIVWALSTGRTTISPEIRTIILVGFMGAFTTFSTFVSETSQLLSDTEILIGLANVSFQVIVGVGMFYLGMAVGRMV